MNKTEKAINQGKQIAYETHESLKQQLLMTRLLNFGAILAVIAMAGAIISMMPLKETILVPIRVDNSTGMMEVLTRIEETTDLTEDEALTKAFMHTFIISIESYHPSAIQHNYDLTLLYSSNQARDDFIKLWDDNNEQNPGKVNGWNYRYNVKVLSMDLIDDRTMLIRFAREKINKENRVIDKVTYSATAKFKFTRKPEKMRNRYNNPLGFKVTHYNRNESYEIE